MVDQILFWISVGRGAAFVFRLIGVHWLAKKILASRLGIVRAPGFEFFPDFKTMKRFRDLGDIMKTPTTIRMILVGGSALVENQTNVNNVLKVILPHPDSPSLALYENSVDDGPALRNKIVTATRKFQEKRINVRWYPHMIHHALIIADPEKKSGWVQWESVLPYAPRDSRPCVIVKKAQFERLILEMHHTFEKMFSASVQPPDMKANG